MFIVQNVVLLFQKETMEEYQNHIAVVIVDIHENKDNFLGI